MHMQFTTGAKWTTCYNFNQGYNLAVEAYTRRFYNLEYYSCPPLINTYAKLEFPSRLSKTRRYPKMI